MPELKKNLIIGAGLAGVASAYWAARQNPSCQVTLIEKEPSILSWTRRKGLGPIVLGHADPAGPEPSPAYPRGWPKAGGFLDKWSGTATRDWLASLGLPLVLDESGSLLLTDAALLPGHWKRILADLGVETVCGYAVESVSPQPDGSFRIWSRMGDARAADCLLMATGGERNHGMAMMREMGIETAPSLPAYVRLRLASPKLGGALGPMSRLIGLRCPRTGLTATGEATLSPRGLEGPVLSQLACRLFEEWSQRRYRLSLEVDWVPGWKASSLQAELSSRCLSGKRRPLGAEPLFGFDERQWRVFLELSRIDPQLPWLRLKTRKLQTLVQRLKNHAITFNGMGLPQGERAWAGGISLDTVDGSSAMSRRIPGLHFAGEMLDFLGEPGGAHLNLVWATAHVAGSALGTGSRIPD